MTLFSCVLGMQAFQPCGGANMSVCGLYGQLVNQIQPYSSALARSNIAFIQSKMKSTACHDHVMVLKQLQLWEI